MAATTKKKISVEIGVARLLDNPLEEQLQHVVKVNYPCDDLGHTMRNAEEPMTSSDRDSEEHNLSPDSLSEDSDCYFCQRHKDGHDNSDMNLGPDNDCYFCQRCHARKKTSANGCAGHGSEFVEDSEDLQALDDSKENIDDVNGHSKSENGIHEISDETEDRGVVKDIQHSSFKYRRVESSSERHVWEREELDGKVMEESDVILNSVFTNEDLEVSDLLSPPVVSENTEVVEGNNSETSEDQSTENSQVVQNPAAIIEAYQSPENSLIQNSVFDEGDLGAIDSSGMDSKTEEHIPKVEDVPSSMEDGDNDQVIQNSVFTSEGLSPENPEAIQTLVSTTNENVCIETQSAENRNGIQDSLSHFDSKDNGKMKEDELVQVTSGNTSTETSQLNEFSPLENYHPEEYTKDLQGAGEVPPESSVQHIDNNPVINNSVFLVDNLDDDILSPVTDVQTDVSTCGSESNDNDNDTGVNFDVSAAYSIKTDDEHDLTKDSAIVLDSPGSFDFSQNTDMSFGDVLEDTNEIMESQCLGGTDFSHNFGDVEKYTNKMERSQSSETMEVSNMSLGNIQEVSNITVVSDDSPKENGVQGDFSGTQTEQGDISGTGQFGVSVDAECDKNLDKSKADNAVNNQGIFLDTSDSVVSSLTTDTQGNIDVQSIPVDGSSVYAEPSFIDQSAISVESYGSESYQPCSTQTNSVETEGEREDQTLSAEETAKEETFESAISDQQTPVEKEDDDSEPSDEEHSAEDDETADELRDASTTDKEHTAGNQEHSDVLEGQGNEPSFEEHSDALTTDQEHSDVLEGQGTEPSFEKHSDASTTDQEHSDVLEGQGTEPSFEEHSDASTTDQEHSDVLEGQGTEPSFEEHSDALTTDQEHSDVLEGQGTEPRFEEHSDALTTDQEHTDVLEGQGTEPSFEEHSDALTTHQEHSDVLEGQGTEPSFGEHSDALTTDQEHSDVLEGHGTEPSFEEHSDASTTDQEHSVVLEGQGTEPSFEEHSDASTTDQEHSDVLEGQGIDIHGQPAMEIEEVDVEKRVNGEPLETPSGYPENVNDSHDINENAEELEPTVADEGCETPSVDPENTNGSLLQSLDFPVIEIEMNENQEVDVMLQSELETPVSGENVETMQYDAPKTTEDTYIPEQLDSIPNGIEEHFQSNMVCDVSKGKEISELEDTADELSVGDNSNVGERATSVEELDERETESSSVQILDSSEAKDEDTSETDEVVSEPSGPEPNPEESISSTSIENTLVSGVLDPVLLASSTPAKPPEKVHDDSESSYLSESYYDPPLFVSVHNMVESFASKENDSADESLSHQKSSGLSVSSEHLAGHVKSNISIFSKPDDVESFPSAKDKLSTSDLSEKSEQMSGNMKDVSKFSKSMPNLYTSADSSHDLSLEELGNRRKPFRAIKDMFERRTLETSNISDRSPYMKEDETRRDGQVINRGKEEKRYSDSFGDTTDGRVVREVNVQSMGGGSAQQNGYDKEEVQYTEMSSVRNAFEAGGPQQNSLPQSQAATWDDQEEGVFENEPVKRSDVARESDRDIGAGLPEIGMAKNLLNRFSQIESEPKDYRKEVTPPRQVTAGKVEFESEPAPHIQVFEGKAEAGIFESQPQINPDVVRSGETVNEPLPERGTAKNIASKFKQLESGAGSYSSPGKREITPDRSAGKVEFVSEPKTTIEKYEGKAEAGIFESQPQHYEGVVRAEDGLEEVLPEHGTAKNIAQRFKQMESGSGASTPRGKREITPDKLTRGEYVSEPRARIEVYEGKAESGVFESQPQEHADVVRSDQYLEESLPERGFARNVAAKFKEMESNTKSPPPTPGRVKEFTPPRETGVFESQPQTSPDVVSEQNPVEEIIPEKGYAKNLVSRFKQIEEENSKVAISNRKNKEFTPPRAESGVYENEPKQFIADYNQKSDSGISENNPEARSDVFKETDPAKYEEELPERGTAKNLVSRWKQMETKSGNQSPGSAGRVKEFTPPREDDRVKAMRTAKSPAGNFESVQPGDLPGQYHQSNEPSMFESEPESRSDVFREADTDWTEGMPKENAAKKRIEKFKQIQANANKEQPKPISRKEDGDRHSPENEVTQQEAATPKKKGGFFIPTTPADKCGACQKTVYAMERFEMNKVIYHKNCFRCSHCKSKLTPKTFAANNGIIYCTNHLMQLFKSKGNYDEGFGREQHKKKWLGEGAKDSEQEAS